MKRCVSITFDVDPTEYHDAEDTPEGSIELVEAMLRRDADLPERMTIACQGVTKVMSR